MKTTKRGRIIIEPTTRALSKQQKEDITTLELERLKFLEKELKYTLFLEFASLRCLREEFEETLTSPLSLDSFHKVYEAFNEEEKVKQHRMKILDADRKLTAVTKRIKQLENPISIDDILAAMQKQRAREHTAKLMNGKIALSKATDE